MKLHVTAARQKNIIYVWPKMSNSFSPCLTGFMCWHFTGVNKKSKIVEPVSCTEMDYGGYWITFIDSAEIIAVNINHEGYSGRAIVEIIE